MTIILEPVVTLIQMVTALLFQNNSDKCRSAARTESLARHQERARAVIRGLTDGLPAPQLPADLEAPFETDVLRHARALPKRAETIDNTPVVLEEYILKSVYAAERGVQKVYYTRLTIYQVKITEIFDFDTICI